MRDMIGWKALRAISLSLPFAMPCSAFAQSMEAWANAHWTPGPVPGDHQESATSSYAGGIFGWSLSDVSAAITDSHASFQPSSTSATLDGKFALLDQALASVPGRGEASAGTSYDFLLGVPTDGFYRFTLDVDILTGGSGNPYFGNANASFAMAGVWSGSTDKDMDVTISKFLSAGTYEIKGGTTADSYADVTGYGFGQATQQFTLAPVPEPASVGLFALGLGVLAAMRRRRG